MLRTEGWLDRTLMGAVPCGLPGPRARAHAPIRSLAGLGRGRREALRVEASRWNRRQSFNGPSRRLMRIFADGPRRQRDSHYQCPSGARRSPPCRRCRGRSPSWTCSGRAPSPPGASDRRAADTTTLGRSAEGPALGGSRTGRRASPSPGRSSRSSPPTMPRSRCCRGPSPATGTPWRPPP